MGLHGLRVAGNNGTTKSLGKELARAQGGWASEQTQSRYDRHDLADVVRIPEAIAASWATREVEFEFGAIREGEGDQARPPPPAPPPPPVVVERTVSTSGSRNVRVTQPFTRGRGSPAPPAVAGAVGTEADVSRGRGRGRGRGGRSSRFTAVIQTLGPVPPPPAGPSHATAQRRDTSSDLLSLTRPVRKARLSAVDRMPASVPGSWSSVVRR